MKKTKSKSNTISVLIPCYNEEKSIKQCVESCLKQTRRPDEIIVVDDASTDHSLAILKSFGRSIKVIHLLKNTGNKSYVQEIGLKSVKGDIFITTDGDTLLDEHFVETIAQDFQDQQVVAVAGYVKSLKGNWLTACREIDYLISQQVHRTASACLNSIFVIPGCAGAFRTKIFRQYIQFDHDTVTEDLDFTHKLHKHQLKITQNSKAIVYTQDPADLPSYIRQMKRWYGGMWQNLRKHLPDILDRPLYVFDRFLAIIEGLVFALLLLLIPFISLRLSLLLLIPMTITSMWAAVYAALVDKRIDLILSFPLMLPLAYVNAVIYFSEFVKEFIFRQKNLVWLRAERRQI